LRKGGFVMPWTSIAILERGAPRNRLDHGIRDQVGDVGGSDPEHATMDLIISPYFE
jgi:hypothetical protein